MSVARTVRAFLAGFVRTMWEVLKGSRRSWKLFSKSKIGMSGLAIIVFFVSMGITAPLLTANSPVTDTNLGAPYSVPFWATFVPKYQNFATTGYPVAPSDFGQAVAGAWTIRGVQDGNFSYRISTAVPRGGNFLPHNPSGSLMVNATIVPLQNYNGTNLLPGGQAFFSMSQSFDITSRPPNVFYASATVEPVEMTNVSSIYLNFLISGPTGNFTMSTTQSQIIGQRITFRPFNVGQWRTVSIDAGLLDTSKIPEFADRGNPSGRIFATRGTYTYTLQVQAVPTGEHPAVSVRIASSTFKIVGGAFGILGTDDLGPDLWSQFVWGSRISLMIGIFSGIGAVAIGTFLGILSGYVGGFWDELLGRITDFILILPFLPLLIILVLLFSQNPALLSQITTLVIILFSLISWPTIAKIIRAQVISVKERQYVEASRALGGGTGHILRRHLLPNVTGLVYSQVALNVAGFILLEAALDFLAVSFYPPNVTSWGTMLSFSLLPALTNAFNDHVWWWFYPPGISIAFLSLAFVLVGFALDSVFNPRLRAR